jgi:hypothetical protein
MPQRLDFDTVAKYGTPTPQSSVTAATRKTPLLWINPNAKDQRQDKLEKRSITAKPQNESAAAK